MFKSVLQKTEKLNDRTNAHENKKKNALTVNKIAQKKKKTTHKQRNELNKLHKSSVIFFFLIRFPRANKIERKQQRDSWAEKDKNWEKLYIDILNIL